MKARILVVEDDPRTAASVALYLRHGGYDVVTARRPEARRSTRLGARSLISWYST